MDSKTMEQLLNAVPLPLILIGTNEYIYLVNQPAAELLGNGLLGRHYGAVLRQPALRDAIEAALKTTAETKARYQNTIADQVALYDVKCVPVADGLVVSFVDVSQLHEAGQMRSDFVANVSHELRSPLTSLLGFIETLRGSARDDVQAQNRFLKIMEQEAKRMTRLVRDLLSLSQVESEERVRPSDTVDIYQLATSCIQTLLPMAKKAGVSLTLEPEGQKKFMVLGDADQLQQVVTNLIENAIKYGALGGKVNVLMHHIEYEPGLRGPAVSIAIHDSGDGIDQIHIPRLTERFYRIDNHRSREMGGTGLGLAIVKHIVNRHRGRFRITSQKGQGSQFTVTLPAA